MKILHIIPSQAKETGGPARSGAIIWQALAESGQEVCVVTTNWPLREGEEDASCTNRSDRLYRLKVYPWARNWPHVNLPCSPLLVKAVEAKFHKYDFIFVHSLWNPVASLVLRAARRAGVRYGIFPHGMLDPLVFQIHRWRKSVWAWLWERANVERASLVVFATQAEEEKARRCGWRFRRTVRISHGIDLVEWKYLPPRCVFEQCFAEVTGREVILFVGRIAPVKNLDILVQALKIVRRTRPQAMLECVGPDNNGYRAAVEGRAATLGLRDHIVFTGALYGEELKAAYARGDVLALVSKKENFGLAAAEALAAGLPVVLSEGVDLSQELPIGGPVGRVKAEPNAIALCIEEKLERRARLRGVDLEAQALAQAKWQRYDVESLIRAIGLAVANR